MSFDQSAYIVEVDVPDYIWRKMPGDGLTIVHPNELVNAVVCFVSTETGKIKTIKVGDPTGVVLDQFWNVQTQYKLGMWIYDGADPQERMEVIETDLLSWYKDHGFQFEVGLSGPRLPGSVFGLVQRGRANVDTPTPYVVVSSREDTAPAGRWTIGFRCLAR